MTTKPETRKGEPMKKFVVCGLVKGNVYNRCTVDAFDLDDAIAVALRHCGFKQVFSASEVAGEYPARNG